jgi:hypothetical protein
VLWVPVRSFQDPRREPAARGASVVMTLKSGTNQLHGNVFEFLRNEKLDANGYFGNRAGAKRNAFRRNIFGGTVGGPMNSMI